MITKTDNKGRNLISRSLKHCFFLCCLCAIASCSFNQKIKNGEMAYDRKQYAIAENLLKNEYEQTTKTGQKGRKAYLIGKSLDYLKNDEEAVVWLERAVIHEYGLEANLELAYAYKRVAKYDKAITLFNTLMDNTARRSEISREIGICREAKRWIKNNDEEYKVNRVYGNSAQADYAPVPYEDGFIVFTSDRGGSTGSDHYNWTGNKFSDLFIMRNNGSNVQRFDALLNTDGNEGTAVFTQDFLEVFFTRCADSGTGDSYCKIMYSQRYDGLWSPPEVLPFVKEGINYGQPALIENDSVLVFSSKIDATVPDYDLFYSVKEDDGTWSEAERMPDIINTKGDEMFPSGEKDTLYFSSDFHPGLGGLDIFKTYLGDDRKWTIPERLPAPVNSSSDDFSFMKDRVTSRKRNELERGFFSSSRKGIGDDDIYNYVKLKVEKEDNEEDPVTEETEERIITYYVAGKVVEPIYKEEFNPNSGIIGYKPVSRAGVRILTGGEEVVGLRANNSGLFVEELKGEQDYNLIAGKNRYLSNSIDFTTKNITVDSIEDIVTINVEIIINRIFKDLEIVINDIFYDLDKATIREDARAPLDQLVKILNDNPEIRIQLSAHTDCRGEDDYNLDLSQRRALSAVKYVIDSGINRERLVPRGYGETQFAIDCDCDSCSEEEHQSNRRTTFKIIS